MAHVRRKCLLFDLILQSDNSIMGSMQKPIFNWNETKMCIHYSFIIQIHWTISPAETTKENMKKNSSEADEIVISNAKYSQRWDQRMKCDQCWHLWHSNTEWVSMRSTNQIKMFISFSKLFMCTAASGRQKEIFFSEFASTYILNLFHTFIPMKWMIIYSTWNINSDSCS